MPDSEKARIRRVARERRRALDGAAQRRAARALAARLAGLKVFAPGRRVAFYIASDGEIDPAQAMRHARRCGTLCLLPVVPGRGRRVLRFAPVGEQTRFRPNRFGIPEPLAPAELMLRAIELDAILLPLVAFDDRGNRVGMGGGFYDATLAGRASQHCLARPRVIGLAHECQRVERIAAAPWDVPLERIVTDRAVYDFSEQADMQTPTGHSPC